MRFYKIVIKRQKTKDGPFEASQRVRRLMSCITRSAYFWLSYPTSPAVRSHVPSISSG